MVPVVSSHCIPNITSTFPNSIAKKSATTTTPCSSNSTLLQTPLPVHLVPSPIVTANGLPFSRYKFFSFTVRLCIKLWVAPLSISTITPLPFIFPFSFIVPFDAIPWIVFNSISSPSAKSRWFNSTVSPGSSSILPSSSLLSSSFMINNISSLFSFTLHLCPGVYFSLHLKHRPLSNLDLNSASESRLIGGSLF